MSQIRLQEFSSVDDISNSIFERLGCADSYYFSKPFLEAFQHNNLSIDYTYLIFLIGENPISLAVVQRMDLSIVNLTRSFEQTNKIVSLLGTLLNGKSIRTTICGNIFLSGNYGVFINANFDKRIIFNELSHYLLKHRRVKKAKLIFLKDFNSKEDEAASVVEHSNFQSFAVEPNMIVDVKWDSFEEYKKSLKSKYRIKVNKADATSSLLLVEQLDGLGIRNHLSRLQELLDIVTAKAAFNSLNLTIETYAALKDRFCKSVLFQVYKKDKLIVGFLTAFHVNNQLDAHFVGIDYEHNKLNAIYPRMLNDYIRIGIEKGVKTINLGRTASEIKSTLGATPEHLRCYAKNASLLQNLFFKPVFKQIKITEFKQHQPFKKVNS